MQILSHRGLWNDPGERNTMAAFERSFRAGYGTETDVRDWNGELVISHDPPTERGISFDDLLTLHASIDPYLPLAINIKADGLHEMLKSAITKRRLANYFLFDHSVPDLKVAIQHGLRCFTRWSEVEQDPPFYDLCAGVWVDTFESEWLTEEHVRRVIGDGMVAALVSPELHRRPHLGYWGTLKAWGLMEEASVLLCTDLPGHARDFMSKC